MLTQFTWSDVPWPAPVPGHQKKGGGVVKAAFWLNTQKAKSLLISSSWCWCRVVQGKNWNWAIHIWIWISSRALNCSWVEEAENETFVICASSPSQGSDLRLSFTKIGTSRSCSWGQALWRELGTVSSDCFGLWRQDNTSLAVMDKRTRSPQFRLIQTHLVPFTVNSGFIFLALLTTPCFCSIPSFPLEHNTMIVPKMGQRC